MDSATRQAAFTADSEEAATQWLPIMLLFLSGCSVALHIGKVPAALPLLIDQLQLSLTQSGLVVSLYSLMIATLGVVLGLMVRRYGYVAFAITGLGLVTIGSLTGSLSNTLQWLLITRVLEGLGWIMSVIAFPPLLSAFAAARDRPLVLGIWGAFVPLGAGAMLVVAPWIQHIGEWQLSWQVAGTATALALFVVWIVTKAKEQNIRHLRMGEEVVPVVELKKPVVWLFSFCFFAYSGQFTAVTSFLPTLFIDTSDWTLAATSRLVALIVLGNVVGNVAAGYLLRCGVSNVSLLIVSAMAMGLSAMIVFTESMGMPVRIAAAFLFSAAGGLIPGTLFASLPKVADNPLAIGLLIGFMLQLAGIGQLIGGVMLPAVVEHFDHWQAAGVYCLLLALGGCVAAALIPRFEK